MLLTAHPAAGFNTSDASSVTDFILRLSKPGPDFVHRILPHYIIIDMLYHEKWSYPFDYYTVRRRRGTTDLEIQVLATVLNMLIVLISCSCSFLRSPVPATLFINYYVASPFLHLPLLYLKSTDAVSLVLTTPTSLEQPGPPKVSCIEFPVRVQFNHVLTRLLPTPGIVPLRRIGARDVYCHQIRFLCCTSFTKIVILFLSVANWCTWSI